MYHKFRNGLMITKNKILKTSNFDTLRDWTFVKTYPKH